MLARLLVSRMPIALLPSREAYQQQLAGRVGVGWLRSNNPLEYLAERLESRMLALVIW